ncbi:hypothetical protein KUU78_31000 (plasmid) [Pseudomonas aeruginosa]|uniref:hypothetical protein n=1 Tax=Pseudomonadota TaxID=1224 RepID=UPI0015C6A139|nr:MULTISPECIES: hypothetical protein [Pseudomonadota]MBY9629136.1 hypothetical protein [Pseudomonas aeruginosa]MBY9844533.1 hypothetical protein [Pseudomonas aeruginosa]MCO8627605.1 hypothetical protein [Burkholderia multivorans]NYS16963.1 hypothetical protein [Achromobacter xylosoxidans]QZV20414.1 hypothetical protein ITG68_30565 [Pseudomonas aeruginosa]
MNDRAPIFFFDKLAALADFTTFDVRATEEGGMPVSWSVVGILANGEIWPVLTDLLTEQHARMIVALCELAAIAPDVVRALNTLPRQKLGGHYADTYELVAALERITR